jgi:hypothetical protein
MAAASTWLIHQIAIFSPGLQPGTKGVANRDYKQLLHQW